MIIRSLSTRTAQQVSSRFFTTLRCRLLVSCLALTIVLGLSGCGQQLYKFPQYNFAGRPIPPSKLANRVMVTLTNGSNGLLQLLDANRDLRGNVQGTILQFIVTGYNGNNPNSILNFPDELRGYVYADAPPYAVTIIDYSKESSAGTAATLNSSSSSLATASDFKRLVSAQEQTGQLIVSDASLGSVYALNLPNVYKVAVSQGDSTVLAMVRDSDTLYRLVKLNANTLAPPGAADCEPTILPVYCIVPVPGTFDRPVGAIFSLDGSTAYILNCGQECGGGAHGGAAISLIPQGTLQVNNIPTSFPYPVSVSNTIAIPGGVTAARAIGTNLYLAGQQLQPDGFYTGFLTNLDLTTLTLGAPVSISDGYHSKLLLADDNSLWIAAQACANGERQRRFASGDTSQAANYNCLTRVALGGAVPIATIVPSVSQAAGSTGPVTVPYPNGDNDQFYYGSLTGLCWVQGLHKVYTAYGGQIHAFHTADGSEINNQFITVPGTALDVAYIDAQDDTSD